MSAAGEGDQTPKAQENPGGLLGVCEKEIGAGDWVASDTSSLESPRVLESMETQEVGEAQATAAGLVGEAGEAGVAGVSMPLAAMAGETGSQALVPIPQNWSVSGYGSGEDSDIVPVEEEEEERSAGMEILIDPHHFPMASFRFMFLDLVQTVLYRMYYHDHLMVPPQVAMQMWRAYFGSPNRSWAHLPQLLAPQGSNQQAVEREEEDLNVLATVESPPMEIEEPEEEVTAWEYMEESWATEDMCPDDDSSQESWKSARQDELLKNEEKNTDEEVPDEEEKDKAEKNQEEPEGNLPPADNMP